VRDYKVIRTAEDHRDAIAEVERLVLQEPKAGSKDGERLELLAILVEDYERRGFTFDELDPIDVIEFRMEEQGLKQRDLVSMMGSRSRVSEVMARKRPLTVQMIRALSSGLGIPADALVGQPEHTPAPEPEKISWSHFPYKEMDARGWFSASRVSGNSIAERLQSFLSNLASSTGSLQTAHFRRRLHGLQLDDKAYYASLAWTARVLQRAADVESQALPAFETSRLSADTLRDIARLSWLQNGPQLAIEFLAKLGVVVVVEERLRSAVLDGAALLTDSRRPVIGLTLRIDRVDYFWFTLMHEVAHVWKHLSTPADAFIDRVERIASADDAHDSKESEANRVARDALIKRSVWERSEARLAPSRGAIQALADELHIHPGIIAGRLQFESGKYQLFREFLGEGEVRKLFGLGSV
jgi:HTH-type transcriptional regulator / antitoxin HigA